jgi:hypothetical protein
MLAERRIQIPGRRLPKFVPPQRKYFQRSCEQFQVPQVDSTQD